MKRRRVRTVCKAQVFVEWPANCWKILLLWLHNLHTWTEAWVSNTHWVWIEYFQRVFNEISFIWHLSEKMGFVWKSAVVSLFHKPFPVISRRPCSSSLFLFPRLDSHQHILVWLILHVASCPTIQWWLWWCHSLQNADSLPWFGHEEPGARHLFPKCLKVSASGFSWTVNSLHSKDLKHPTTWKLAREAIERLPFPKISDKLKAGRCETHTVMWV